VCIHSSIVRFESSKKGSIEVGKFADFVLLNQDIMKIEGSEIPKTNAVSTYLNGEKVY
jgi:predicted amidohydrolase YtcJ